MPCFLPSSEMQDYFRATDSYLSFTETSKWTQVHTFSTSSTLPWDKSDKSRICWSSPAGAFAIFQCFHFPDLSIGSSTVIFGNFWSPCTKCWCGEVRALNYSPLSFQANFSASSALPLRTKMDTISSFFFEGIRTNLAAWIAW